MYVICMLYVCYMYVSGSCLLLVSKKELLTLLKPYNSPNNANNAALSVSSGSYAHLNRLFPNNPNNPNNPSLDNHNNGNRNSPIPQSNLAGKANEGVMSYYDIYERSYRTGYYIYLFDNPAL